VLQKIHEKLKKLKPKNPKPRLTSPVVTVKQLAPAWDKSQSAVVCSQPRLSVSISQRHWQTVYVCW